jgi:regulatory protein
MESRPPDEAALHEAALAHLARYAATRAGLVRVLDRRVERWARRQEESEPEAVAAAVREARALVRRVADRLEAAGILDDAAFAQSRARALARAGRSARAIAAHLAVRGVPKEVTAAAVPDDPEAEFAAALAWAKRRRIGPFRRAAVDAEGRRRELAVLARAGFGHEVARRALDADAGEAEQIVNRLRRT